MILLKERSASNQFMLRNYFDNLIKLFSDLTKCLDISIKLFFQCLSEIIHQNLDKHLLKSFILLFESNYLHFNC